jgi:hypothetical protein
VILPHLVFPGGTLRVRACFMLERMERVKERDNQELECGHASCLQGCIHPLHRPESEREGGGREGERERERESEKEGGTERERKESIYF